MDLSSLLTPSEKRLAVLLFLLTLLSSVSRVGRYLSSDVETWLNQEMHCDSTTASPPPRGTIDSRPVKRDGPRRRSDPGPAEVLVRIDPNTASREELLRLPGVGPVLAERILEDRIRNGPYGSPEDLLRVKGIGMRTLARLRPHLKFP